jgi:hypothetical protein
MSATHISLSCPHCEESFLTLAAGPLSMQACPHCAYTAQLGQFEAVSQQAVSAGPSKRETRRFGPTGGMAAPVTPSAPLPQPVLRSTPFSLAEPQNESEPMPPMPMPTAGAMAALATEPRSPLPESLPTLPEDWSPLQPSSGPRFSPAGVMAEGAVFSHTLAQARERRLTWLWLSLGCLILAGAGLIALKPEWITGQTASLSAEAEPTWTKSHPVLLAKPAAPSLPPSPESSVGYRESAAQVNRLIQAFQTAKTTDERIACLAYGEQKRQAVGEFFASSEGQISLHAFRPLPVMVKLLPSGSESPIFEAQTHANNTGSTLLRLTGPDREHLRLDWDLLKDSHTGALAKLGKDPSAAARWISVGLTRSFGLEEAKEIREAYHVFDVQGTATGDRTLAFAAKDSPFGRALDQAVSWEGLYIVRMLVGWTPVGGQPRLTLLEGLSMPGMQ